MYLKDFSKITELKVGYDFKYFDQIARSGQRGEPLLSSSIDFYSLAKLPTYAGSYLETIWNIKRDEIRIKTTRLVYHKITRPTFSNLQTAMRSTQSFRVRSALDCSLYRWRLIVYFTFPSTWLVNKILKYNQIQGSEER